MTHSELVEHGSRWMAKYLRAYIVTTELKTSESEIPDVLGWSAGGTHLIEVKVTRADFLTDRKKRHRREPRLGMGVYRWYLAPKGMISIHEIPPNWGLAEKVPQGVRVLRKPVAFRDRNERGETQVLISCLRRIGQNAPEGISIRCYTLPTACTSSLGIRKKRRRTRWLKSVSL